MYVMIYTISLKNYNFNNEVNRELDNERMDLNDSTLHCRKRDIIVMISYFLPRFSKGKTP